MNKLRRRLYFLIVLLLFYNYYLFSRNENFESFGGIKAAFIINGDKNGNLNEKRWKRPYHICSEILGLSCKRIPSFYVNGNGKTEIHDLCGKIKDYSIRSRNVIGTNNAHRKALEAVVQHGEKSIIFEDDIILPLDISATVSKISAFIKESKNKDVAYLGHCFNGNCLHAYIVSPNVAKKLLQKINWCSSKSPFDNQLVYLCKTGRFKCSYAETIKSPRVKKSWGEGLIFQEGKPVRSEPDF